MTTLKRVTRVHLTASYQRTRFAPHRHALANSLRETRRDYGPAEARRQYRNSFGPLLPLD